jgi:AraC-like DNA-binding protein
MSEISYSATYLDDTARKTAAYIYSNNDFSMLTYGSEPDVDVSSKLVSGLGKLAFPFSNIFSIYIYNGGIDTFYSTWWRPSTRADSFLDSDIVDIMHNNRIPDRKKFTSTPILRKVPLSINDGTSQTSYKNVLTYILADYTVDNKVQSAIIINLDSEYLDGLIRTLNTKGSLTEGSTFILNEKGQIITSSNSNSTFGEFKKDRYVKSIIDSKEKVGYFIEPVDGERVVVTYVSSDDLSWKFVNVTPYDEVFKDINTMKGKIYLFCLGVLVFGFFLSFFLAKRLYTPIHTMVGKVQKLSNIKLEKNSANELEFLTGVFTETIEKARKMQSLSHENNEMKKNAFLKGLLIKENFDEKKATELLKNYKIEMTIDSKFVLCNFCIDHYANFSQELSMEDQSVFRFAICNVAAELALRYFKNQCFEADSRNIVLLLELKGPEDKGQSADELLEIVKEIQEWCHANLKISLSAAVSVHSAGLGEISEAFKGVQELSKYRLVAGHKSVLLPEMLLGKKSSAFEHPAALEQKLDEALNNGKLKESIEAYNKIIEYISEYTYDTINSYILYLTYLILKKFNDLEAKGYEKILFDSNRFIREIISLETLTEISEKIVDPFKAITNTIEQKRYRKKNCLSEKVRNIIENEYMDKSLCQDSVANRLNISRDYLGKIFREAYSKSFADYLTEVRLQKAVELLKSKKKSVAEIMDDIGWENKNYFYTTFKQRYGITTSEFRNMK